MKLLIGIALASSLLAQKPAKVKAPQITITVTPPDAPQMVPVLTTASTKMVVTPDGQTTINIARADISSPTLTVTVVGNTYTYTLSNAFSSAAAVDMLYIPTQGFDGPMKVSDPDWIGGDGGIVRIKKGLPAGGVLVFSGVGKDGTQPTSLIAQALTFVQQKFNLAQFRANHPDLYPAVKATIDKGVDLPVLGPQ